VRIAAIRLTTERAKTAGLDTSSLEEDRPLLGKLLARPEPASAAARSRSRCMARTKVAPMVAQLALQHDAQRSAWYLEALGNRAPRPRDECSMPGRKQSTNPAPAGNPADATSSGA